MAENPVKKVRIEKEATQHELALAAGVSVSTVRNIENGQVSKLNEALLSFLEKKGYDPEKLRKEYQEWLEKRKEEAAEKF